MKRTIIALLMATLAWPVSSISAQGECSSCTIYKGYISGNMEMWKQGMQELQDKYILDPDPCTLYSLVETRYGYIGYLLGREEKNAAKPLIEAFAGEVEKLALHPQYRAETEAFRVALLGFRMGLNPARAVTLGPKALKQLDAAVKIGKDSPVVWLEKANSEVYMPAFAGGSKEKAKVSFSEALRLFEADKNMSPCNWRYLNTIVLLGHLQDRMGDYRGSRETFLRALRREPDFQWVRDELLPAVEKKIK